jgi:drug/metabolite transporter (DMT)-like permease
VRLSASTIWYLLLATVSGVSYGFAGTILKKGAVSLKLTGGVFAIFWRIVTAKYVLISLVFSGVGYILYMFIIRKAEVITTTLIIQGVLFVSAMFFAALLFKETVTPAKIVAVLLIAAGIAVLVAGK